MAITITMLLVVAWQFAEDRASVRAADTVDLDAGATDAVALVTPVLSVRRAPGVLSRRLNVAAFRDALRPVFEGLNDTSCLAVSVDGQPISSANSNVGLLPASNMKLLTAAVAAESLGKSYIFTTRVTGDVGPDGVVAGDLFLIGGGDPLLSSEWWPTSTLQPYPPFNTTKLEALADGIVARGITRVTGGVVGDGSRYDDEWFVPSWDLTVQRTEGGPIDALVVNDGHDNPFETTHVADDPAIGAATVLALLLQGRGVTIDGPSAARDSTSTTELASVNSAPLSEIIVEMLQTSDNNTAEMLLKEVGLQAKGLGTREAGLGVVTKTLDTWGIPMNQVVLADGSGLSNDNRLTCDALLALVQHGSYDDVIGSALPVAGESGTLADAFIGTPLAGRLRAKTGTLNNLANPTSVGVTSDPPAAKSLSGYVVLDGGGSIEFSLLLNGQTISGPNEFGRIWFTLLEPALASYSRGASIADLGPR